MECFFPIQTVKDKALPVWIAGIGYDKYQRHRIRQKEFPYYQISLCEKGSGRFIIGGKEYLIEKGMLFSFAARVPHEYYPVSEQWSVRWILFDGISIGTIMNALGLQTHHVPKRIKAEDYHICYNRIWKLLTTHQSRGMSEASGLLYQYLTSLNFDRDNLDIMEKDKKQIQLDLTLRYIKDNVQTEFSLSEVSDYLKLSSSYLCRIFKEKYGTSPIAYANQYKINLAKDYLINHRDKSIKEISASVGFRDSSYFIAVFKKHENLTPKQFRMMYTKSAPPVKRVVCSEAVSLCYWPAPKGAGFHFVQATLPL